MKTIVTNRRVALGNGTRQAGFPLGTTEDPDQTLYAAATNHNPDLKTLGVILAEGVSQAELVCALCNPLLVSFVDENGEQPGDNPPGDFQAPEDWAPVAIADVEEIPEDVAKLLAALAESTEGKFPNITTLGELFSFGEQHHGFTVIKGIGNATDTKLRSVLKQYMPPEV